MVITQHPSNNSVLGAPPGVSIEDCRALPITRGLVDGKPVCISYWKPTDAEIELILRGKCVALWVWGMTHAPVAVGVDES